MASLPITLSAPLHGWKHPQAALIRSKLKDVLRDVVNPERFAQELRQNPFALLEKLEVKKQHKVSRPWNIKHVDVLAQVLKIPPEMRAKHMMVAFIQRLFKQDGATIMSLQEVRAAMADMECATDIPMDRRWQALLALVDSGQMQAPVPQHIAPASIMNMESVIFDYMRDPEYRPTPEVAGVLKE